MRTVTASEPRPVVTCSYCLAQEEHTIADCPDLEVGKPPFSERY